MAWVRYFPRTPKLETCWSCEQQSDLSVWCSSLQPCVLSPLWFSEVLSASYSDTSHSCRYLQFSNCSVTKYFSFIRNFPDTDLSLFSYSLLLPSPPIIDGSVDEKAANSYHPSLLSSFWCHNCFESLGQSPSTFLSISHPLSTLTFAFNVWVRKLKNKIPKKKSEVVEVWLHAFLTSSLVRK